MNDAMWEDLMRSVITFWHKRSSEINGHFELQSIQCIAKTNYCVNE
jgi:hypothetical protein